ncbi:NADPH-dependent 7-cyano-7-deazaguanine reductase QueF [Salinimonas sediminis]|uniref:NADPH-dependent 7-cyano-7-deazaguanine reductase n=1 Tax=Salinimonas sediminis TaxID=2303538 RepID=A0A346NJF0_9ALTE|nr:NADPH-dependent 7-cyano-7-deazaguanine reductase QueF [Salinimonas sediminis]AXR05657.1 NADPH-dependent 7-cyano-7-deazaguanine reductase QueF [Salinimonas sediminis]
MTNNASSNLPDNLTLGQQVAYDAHYNPELLQGVARSISRDAQHISGPDLPFSGIDTWTGYELSWLNAKGKPQVGIVECHVPVTSANLIESKSFKLYLNSYNQTHFDDLDAVKRTLQADLSRCAGEQVTVAVFLPHQFNRFATAELAGVVIDDIDIEIDQYSPDPNLLRTEHKQVSETLVSHLLKSNCLITSQPDWASVLIKYEGQALNHEQLLRYLIGFRQHNEFHEQCVERIFCDIKALPGIDKLTVLARYTRRGGLDINPFRSNFEAPYPNQRNARQ